MLLQELQLSEPLHDVPVLLIVPARWSRDVRNGLLQILLGRIGVGGVYFGDAPLMAAFGCATANALVVDVGHTVTEVTAVVDGEIVPGAAETLLVGGRDVETRLAALLEQDALFQKSLQAHQALSKESLAAIVRAAKECPATRAETHPTDASPSVSFCFEEHTVLPPYLPVTVCSLRWALAEQRLSGCFSTQPSFPERKVFPGSRRQWWAC